jgi:hypothetical protein
MERETTLVNPRVRTHGPSIVRIPGVDVNRLPDMLAVRPKVALLVRSSAPRQTHSGRPSWPSTRRRRRTGAGRPGC